MIRFVERDVKLAPSRSEVVKFVAVQGFGAASVAFSMMGDERGDPISDCEILAVMKHGD